MKNGFILLVFILISASQIKAQNFDYSLEVIRELSDTAYHGRAFYEQGDLKAARYIASEYQKHNLKSWNQSFFQEFSFSANTFQGDMDLLIDGKQLKPGYDFVLRSYSNGAEGNYNIFKIDTAKYDKEKCFKQLEALDSTSDAVLCSFDFVLEHRDLYKAIYHSPAQVIIFSWEDPLKFYKAQASTLYHKCVIWTQNTSMPEKCKTVHLDIDNHFIEEHETQNVLAYMEADDPNAEWLLFTAHYDHIGMLGENVYFPGANDNASGVSMLLSLADEYKNKARKYNMAFLAVAGEECGLLGSIHYAENPAFPLEDIKLVINLDMVADNGDSLYVQRSDAAEDMIRHMEAIAQKENLFAGFELAELSPHSDHYPFAEKEIPAVFFSTHGDINQHYHTPLDDIEHIHMSGFENLYNLIKKFIDD